MPNICKGPLVVKPGDKFTKVNKKGSRPATRRGSKTDITLPSTSATLVDESEEILCKKCSQEFNDDLSIECDRCMSWFHQGCTRLAKKHIEYISSNPTLDLKWFCEPCQQADLVNPNVLLAQQAAQLEALTMLVSTLQQQTLKQNDLIIQMLSKNKSTDEAIQVHVSEVLNEQKEKDEKKSNLIMVHLPEVEEGVEKPDEVDLKKVIDVLSYVDSEVNTASLNTTKVSRIGRRRTGPDSTPRLIKITLDSPQSRDKFLSKARTLKDNSSFKKIGLFSDKTKKEQEAYRQLKQQCDRLKAETGEEHVVFRDECVKRSDIPEIKKRGKVSSKEAEPGAPGNA